MAIRPARADDFEAIAAITNHYIVTTSIHFAYAPITLRRAPRLLRGQVSVVRHHGRRRRGPRLREGGRMAGPRRLFVDVRGRPLHRRWRAWSWSGARALRHAARRSRAARLPLGHCGHRATERGERRASRAVRVHTRRDVRGRRLEEWRVARGRVLAEATGAAGGRAAGASRASLIVESAAISRSHVSASSPRRPAPTCRASSRSSSARRASPWRIPRSPLAVHGSALLARRRDRRPSRRLPRARGHRSTGRSPASSLRACPRSPSGEPPHA